MFSFSLHIHTATADYSAKDTAMTLHTRDSQLLSIYHHMQLAKETVTATSRRADIQTALQLTGTLFDAEAASQNVTPHCTHPDMQAALARDTANCPAPDTACMKNAKLLLSYSLCKTDMMLHMYTDPDASNSTALIACQKAEQHLRTAFLCACRIERGVIACTKRPKIATP